MNKEEKKEIDKLWERVDYVVGDWVETCKLLPAIVQNIVIRYDEKNDYIEEYVEVFYPHMVFDAKYDGKYNGGNICSVDHCGVHKITPQYACMLMSLGHDKLSELYNVATEAWKNDSQKLWSEFVTEEYEKVFVKK